MNQATSKRLTIFEGPDGVGKSTAARRYAELTDSLYVHLGPFPNVRHGLGRLYLEAMLPALLGYQNVVLDRSWLSETPYGLIYRDAKLRLEVADLRMLDRVAMRCGACVVLCLPPWAKAKENYLATQGEQMLDHVEQAQEVYDLYAEIYKSYRQLGALPTSIYDYTAQPNFDDWLLDQRATAYLRMPQHPLNLHTVGNWDAKTVLVGENFAEHQENDPLRQWPFVSFSNQGCSRWFTDQLERHNVLEQDLFWVNADQDLEFLQNRVSDVKVIALGQEAEAALYKLKINTVTVPHPQHQRRFGHHEHYELFDYLKGGK